jgi:hypothetical protein
MSPQELWWFIEAKLPQRKYGSLTEDEISALYEEMKAAGHEAQMLLVGQQLH